MPSSSSTQTSVPGIALPTEVGLLSTSSGGRWQTRVALGLPVHQVELGVGEGLADRADAGAGKPAPALVRKRRCGSSARPVPQESRIWKIVGTAGKPVIRSSSKSLHDPPAGAEARLEHKRRADPHADQQVVEAVVEGQRQDAEDPIRAGMSRYSMIESATKDMLRCDSVTPFGSPVEPDV